MKNNKGAALLQVLMLSALLAGLSVMVLRATLSRQVTANQTRHAVGTQLAIEACAAEIHNMWAVMNPETYATYLNTCSMPVQKNVPTACTDDDGNKLTASAGTWYCSVKPFGKEYCVKAVMSTKDAADVTSSPCRLTFSVRKGTNL